MSDSSSEKQFEPTEEKLRKSREEGNALIVQQVTTGFLLFAFFIIFGLLIKIVYSLYTFAFNGSVMVIERIGRSGINALMYAVIGKNLLLAYAIVGGIIFILSIFTVSICLIQLKGFRVIPYTIKFDKFNFVNNAKEKFSAKNLVKLFLDVGFVLLFFIVAGLLFIKNITNVSRLLEVDFYNQVAFFEYFFKDVTNLTLLMLFVFIVIVYVVERKFYMKNQMMTREEVKQETENNEGKAEVKGRIRELRHELLEDDEVGDIAENMGSFVLANPTHYAILFMYSKDNLPITILKGEDSQALQIIEVCKKLGLPVIHNKFLARQVYPLLELGKPIPRIFIRDFGELIGMHYHLIQPFIRDFGKISQYAKTKQIQVN